MQAQPYGDEGPTLTPNRLGLVYEGAIERNEPGRVQIRRVDYEVDGLPVVANVYTPAGYTPEGHYAAVVVAHPNGGSKEQVAGLYAQRLAEAGFVAIAFDARYQGESGGQPRRTDKPAHRMGDIYGAVDFIQRFPGVDPARVGAFGICGGGGYTFAAGLFGLGLGAGNVFLSLTFGIIIAFMLMNLSGWMGQATGLPYPVLARIAFGTFGANVPALIRGFVAIVWYGIQTYLASNAVVILILKLAPGLEKNHLLTKQEFLGLSLIGWIAFLLMWALQLLLLRNGMETIRRFQDWAGPAVWVVMALLTVYILYRAGWQVNLNLSNRTPEFGTLHAFLAATALTVSYFSTLMLNFCDFSRNAPDRRSVTRANLWGLPVNFIAFSVVSVLVTAGTYEVYGDHIFDPVEVVGRIDSVLAAILGAITFAVATLGINVVANFVSPAYDLANAAPKHIDFKKGGLISACIALVILPWQLYKNPVVVNIFLEGVGAVLGPLFGIIMVDYFILRRQKVLVLDLFKEEGHYTYAKGWNMKAVWVTVGSSVVSAAFVILGVLAKTGKDAPFAVEDGTPALDMPFFEAASSFSWFIGAALGGLLTYLTMRNDDSLRKSVAAAMDAEAENANEAVQA